MQKSNFGAAAWWAIDTFGATHGACFRCGAQFLMRELIEHLVQVYIQKREC